MPKFKTFVISCKWPDGSQKYLAGHCAGSETATCLFTDKVEEAISCEAINLKRQILDMFWPFLLKSHMEKTGVRFEATIHSTDQVPVFKS